MREKPSGADLLDIARDVLRNDLLPALPEENRYQALMIANAMAIVMRQLAAGEAGETNEQTKLETSLGIKGSLEQLNSTLANRIRSGDADGPEIWQALHDVATAKVAESNPKYC